MSISMARIEEEKHYVGFDLLQNIKITLNDSIKMNKDEMLIESCVMFIRRFKGKALFCEMI